MRLNIQNIENVLFMDDKARALLPEFQPAFDQWKLAVRVSGMGFLLKKSLLDVLNSLDNEHLHKLEEYWKEKIILDRIDYRTVAEYQGGVLDPELCQFSEFKDFCVHRDGDGLSVLFWR